MDWRQKRRGHGRKSLARKSTRRSRLAGEQLERRLLLSADSLLPPDVWDEAMLPDSMVASALIAEGESSLPDLKIQQLDSLSLSGGTGYKAQSKVWHHDGKWWAAGTKIWRLSSNS